MARLAQARSEAGLFAPTAVDALFDDIGLPRPAKTSNILASLEKKQLLTRVKKGQGGATWKLTPEGTGQAEALATNMGLAPPALIKPLHEFLAEHPFDTNVFGMTRFPTKQADGQSDPVAMALNAAKAVCEKHGLEFHLASDRQIVDDLWPNVAAHMWGCRYGIAFFESVTDKGLNYNLNIEVGSCLVLGRRLALLKDKSLKTMPTDLVGHIYHDVDLAKPRTVTKRLDDWISSNIA